MLEDVVDVITQRTVVEVINEDVLVVDVFTGARGPRGLVGSGLVWDQTIPLSSWTIPHEFGRRPDVTIYIGNEIVDTDVYATATTVTVVFPTPRTGQAVLT